MTADKQSTLMPKLRFREFRDDPAWLAPQLADLYGFKRTYTLSRDQLNYEIGTIRNIHYGDIHTKFKTLFRVGTENVPYVNPDDSASGFDDGAFCEEGDIVLADASEDLDGVGKAIEIVSLDGERVVAGTHTILASRRGSVPVVGFGGQLFQSAAVRAGIKKEAQGAKVYGISANRISAVLVPVPPTEAEQQRIADCLGSLDGLIAAKDRKLEALQQYKQGLILQLFPQPGETLPRLRFPEFRVGPAWEQAIVGDLIDTVSPPMKFTTPNYLAHGRFPIIDQSQSDICGWTDDNEAVIASPLPVIIFGDHTCTLKLVDRPFAQGADGIKILAARHRVATVYLYHHLNCRPVMSEEYKRHFSDLKEKVIFFPSVDSGEQQKIADCLSSLDDLIAAEGRKLEALRLHRHGLLQQIFPDPEA